MAVPSWFNVKINTVTVRKLYKPAVAFVEINVPTHGFVQFVGTLHIEPLAENIYPAFVLIKGLIGGDNVHHVIVLKNVAGDVGVSP